MTTVLRSTHMYLDIDAFHRPAVAAPRRSLVCLLDTGTGQVRAGEGLDAASGRRRNLSDTASLTRCPRAPTPLGRSGGALVHPTIETNLWGHAEDRSTWHTNGPGGSSHKPTTNNS